MRPLVAKDRLADNILGGIGTLRMSVRRRIGSHDGLEGAAGRRGGLCGGHDPAGRHACQQAQDEGDNRFHSILSRFRRRRLSAAPGSTAALPSRVVLSKAPSQKDEGRRMKKARSLSSFLLHPYHGLGLPVPHALPVFKEDANCGASGSVDLPFLLHPLRLPIIPLALPGRFNEMDRCFPAGQRAPNNAISCTSPASLSYKECRIAPKISVVRSLCWEQQPDGRCPAP